MGRDARRHRRTNGEPDLVFRSLLVASVGAFILFLFLASAMPGLSRLVHLSILFMALSLITGMARQGLRLTPEPVIIVTWAFFLFASASTTWSPLPEAAVIRAVSLLFDVLGATLVWIALRNGLKFGTVAAFVGAGAAVQAAVALAQFSSGPSLRVEGLAGNANSLAIQLSISAFLLLMVAWKRPWLHALALALIVTATFASGSRKLAFVWFAYALVLGRSLAVRMRTPLVAGLVLVAAPLSMLGLLTFGDVLIQPIRSITVVQRIERTFAGEESSAIKRVDLGRDAVAVWAESPLIGTGIDQFRYTNANESYSHNNYTELLADFGLVGFALYYSIPVLLLARVLRGLSFERRRRWLILATVVLLLLLDVARVAYSSGMTWLVVALLAHLSTTSDRREGDVS